MRLSHYTILTEHGDGVFLTGLLSQCVIQVPYAEWEEVKSHLDNKQFASSSLRSLFDELHSAKIIVDDDFDELQYVVERSIVARSISDTFGLVIVPSMACNMNCHYCFENKSNPRSLTSPDIQALVEFTEDKLLDSQFENFYVQWFGGEPLRDVVLVEQTTRVLGDLCQRLDKRLTGDVVTNGYNLTADVAKRLSDVGICTAQVTLEGERDQHDRIRRVGDGGSYDRIVQNILGSAQFLDIRIRIHVTPGTLVGIPTLLRDMHERGVHEAVERVYFAPLFNYDQDQKELAFLEQPNLYLSSKDFAKHAVELHRQAKSLGFTLTDPLATEYSVCTALREYTVVVNPDGSLAKCYMDAGDLEETFGTLRDGVTNGDNLSKWRQVLFSEDEECRECKFLPVCFGGCAKETLKGADKSVVCTPLKYNMDELVPIHYG